jgi:hypothetical protein
VHLIESQAADRGSIVGSEDIKSELIDFYFKVQDEELQKIFRLVVNKLGRDYVCTKDT